eukprot:scaffold66669_cov78-Phaeocystis_antarctica.AAC.2
MSGLCTLSTTTSTLPYSLATLCAYFSHKRHSLTVVQGGQHLVQAPLVEATGAVLQVLAKLVVSQRLQRCEMRRLPLCLPRSQLFVNERTLRDRVDAHAAHERHRQGGHKQHAALPAEGLLQPAPPVQQKLGALIGVANEDDVHGVEQLECERERCDGLTHGAVARIVSEPTDLAEMERLACTWRGVHLIAFDGVSLLACIASTPSTAKCASLASRPCRAPVAGRPSQGLRTRPGGPCRRVAAGLAAAPHAQRRGMARRPPCAGTRASCVGRGARVCAPMRWDSGQRARASGRHVTRSGRRATPSGGRSRAHPRRGRRARRAAAGLEARAARRGHRTR